MLPLGVRCGPGAGLHRTGRGCEPEPAVPAGSAGQPLQEEAALLRGAATGRSRGAFSDDRAGRRTEKASRRCRDGADFWNFPRPRQIQFTHKHQETAPRRPCRESFSPNMDAEDCTFNSFQYWRAPLPELDLSLLEDVSGCSPSTQKSNVKDSFSDVMET
uniref:Putative WW-binding domain-containing protein n=1 Tax=Echeneis naucrates TaxID=173247 RepID=A0A665U8E9_ECHNA